MFFLFGGQRKMVKISMCVQNVLDYNLKGEATEKCSRHRSLIFKGTFMLERSSNKNLIIILKLKLIKENYKKQLNMTHPCIISINLNIFF